MGFWKSIGAGDVVWAQDSQRVTAREYELQALGTEVIVDRKGRITFRSDGPAGFKRLEAEIEKVL